MPQPGPRRVRTPRYGRFLVTGGVVGLLAAVISSFLPTTGSAVPRANVVLYIGLLFTVVGGLLGGLVALLVERGGGGRRRGRP